MSKIYKIDDAEFEELIKTIALNNESIIENNDPVLMFYTIAKYVFKEYAEELDNRIDNAGQQQRDVIDEFKAYLDNKKIEDDKEFLSKVQFLTNEIKISTDEKDAILNTENKKEISLTSFNTEYKSYENYIIIKNEYYNYNGKLIYVDNSMKDVGDN